MSGPADGTVEERLAELGYTLPPAMAPITKYRWATRDGNVIYLAGHGPFLDGKPTHVGKVGKELTVDEAYEANRFVGLTMLRTLKEEIGSLDLIEAPLFHVNYVNVAPGVGDTYILVANGSTDLWISLWGEEIGCCARMTVGVAELPCSVPTAITSTWRVRGT
ncbi:MAG TPA: RidA family protein [Acidimicrobiales bacterium]|nr:RidA family protein [Acidimicrobiales bacterium]